MSTSEQRLIDIICGAELTKDELKALSSAYDELLNEWLSRNQHHFESKEDAIEYYINLDEN